MALPTAVGYPALAEAIALWHDVEFDRAVQAAQELAPAEIHDLSKHDRARGPLSRLGQLDGTGHGWPDDD